MCGIEILWLDNSWLRIWCIKMKVVTLILW